MKLKTLLQGCGIAILLMISHLAPLISPYHSVLYHSVLPVRSVIWGTLIDFALLSLAMALLFAYVERKPGGRRFLIWTPIAAIVAHRIVGACADLGFRVPI